MKLRLPSFVGALGVLALAACSVMTTSTGAPGGSSGSSGTSGSSGSSSGAGSSGASGSSGSSGTSSTGGDGGNLPADGAVPQGGGAGGDAQAPDDRLMPLEVGRSWTYDVAAVGGGYCTTGLHDVKVLGQSQKDGRNAFEVTSFCSQVGSAFETVNGDQVDVDYQGAWNHYLDVPVQDGHQWPYFNTSYTWVAVPTITVPAGTFTGCWKANQNVTYTAYSIFCRGVGMVESYSQDLSGSGWDAKLSSKNF